MFRVANKDIRATLMTSLFLLLTLNLFTPFSYASIIDFEQVNVSWDGDKLCCLWVNISSLFSPYIFS